ncbi:hypothetical protein TGP89_217680 [Toxoplasma gondii p89]|uniref:Uncharacterized protein n=2 Tax=Toxoplasma gondii TaxID=5811 RepID=A0A2T6ITJ7_TOXGO|nr:hypothetical protein TGP89_217680 [Toxoplasma gondii p89]PUA88653.1 hypothetical protein TGBR9_217680 [Toxoplasma gondii TgCATBr9]
MGGKSPPVPEAAGVGRWTDGASFLVCVKSGLFSLRTVLPLVTIFFCLPSETPFCSPALSSFSAGSFSRPDGVYGEPPLALPATLAAVASATSPEHSTTDESETSGGTIEKRGKGAPAPGHSEGRTRGASSSSVPSTQAKQKGNATQQGPPHETPEQDSSLSVAGRGMEISQTSKHSASRTLSRDARLPLPSQLSFHGWLSSALDNSGEQLWGSWNGGSSEMKKGARTARPSAPGKAKPAFPRLISAVSSGLQETSPETHQDSLQQEASSDTSQLLTSLKSGLPQSAAPTGSERDGSFGSVTEPEVDAAEGWELESQAEAVEKVEASLQKRVSKLTGDIDWLQKQLDGVVGDMQMYRSALVDLRPQRSVEAFEQIAAGGRNFPHRTFLEQLENAVNVMDSRISTFVRTNSTLFESQLREAVNQRLTPLRRDVVDLSFAMLNASDTSVALASELDDISRGVNVTIDRHVADVELFKDRREAVYEEDIRQEEYRIRARLEELKQSEQSRINRSSLEEQILSAAVADAVHEMERRGVGVLDVSTVYPNSEAKKVLELLLYMVAKQQDPSWEVLPIVLVTAPPPPLPVQPRPISDLLVTTVAGSHSGHEEATRGGGGDNETELDDAGRGASLLRGELSESSRSTTSFHSSEEDRGKNESGDEDMRNGSLDEARRYAAEPGWVKDGDETDTADLQRGAEDSGSSVENRRRANKKPLHEQRVRDGDKKPEVADGAREPEGESPAGEGESRQLLRRGHGKQKSPRREKRGKKKGVADAGEGMEEKPGDIQRGGDGRQDPEREERSRKVPERRRSFFGNLFGRAKRRLQRERKNHPAHEREAEIWHAQKATTARAQGNRETFGDWGMKLIYSYEGASQPVEPEEWTNVTQMLPPWVIRDAAVDDRPLYALVPPLATLQRLVYEHFQALPPVHLPAATSARDPATAVSAEMGSDPRGGAGGEGRGSAKLEPVEAGPEAENPATRVAEVLDAKQLAADVADGEKDPREEGDPRDEEELQMRLQRFSEEVAHAEDSHRLESTDKVEETSRAASKEGGYYVLRVSGLVIESYFFSADHQITSVPTFYPVSEPVTGFGPFVSYAEYGAQFMKTYTDFQPPFPSLSPVGDDADLVGAWSGSKVLPREAREYDALSRFQPTRALPLDVAIKKAEKRAKRAGQRGAASSTETVESGSPEDQADEQDLRVPAEDGLALLIHVQQETRGEGESKPEEGEMNREKGNGVYGGFNPFVCCLNQSSTQLSEWCVAPQRNVFADGRDEGAERDRETIHTPSSPPEVSLPTLNSVETQVAATAGPKLETSGFNSDNEETLASSRVEESGQKSGTTPGTRSESAALFPTAVGKRKVLVVYLGPRTDGLPLRYQAGSGGELRRLQLTQSSVETLVQHLDGVCTADFSRKTETKGDRKQSTKKQADAQKRAPHMPSCTALDSFVHAPLGSRFWKQLMTLKHEMYVSNASKWATSYNRRLMDKHQIDVETAFAQELPPLFLPLSSFFQENVLLIRIHVASCPSRRRGSNEFAVPPVSVLERAVYLIGYPAAGLAAVAAYSYATRTQSKLTRLKETAKAAAAEAFPHYQPVMSAMQTATAEAGLWGRTSGAGEASRWIANVHVKFGKSSTSSIDLLDASLRSSHSDVGNPESRGGREQFWKVHVHGEEKRRKQQNGGNEDPFYIKGVQAGEAEAAVECATMPSIVTRVGSLMETRVIPRLYASELRGRKILVTLSSDQTPFLGERFFAGDRMEEAWKQVNLMPTRNHVAEKKKLKVKRTTSKKTGPAAAAKLSVKKTVEVLDAEKRRPKVLEMPNLLVENALEGTPHTRHRSEEGKWTPPEPNALPLYNDHSLSSNEEEVAPKEQDPGVSKTPESRAPETPEAILPEERMPFGRTVQESVKREGQDLTTPKGQALMTSEGQDLMTPEGQELMTREGWVLEAPEERESMTSDGQESVAPYGHESVALDAEESVAPEEHESVTPKHSEALTFERQKEIIPEADESVRPQHSEPLTFERQKEIIPEADESVRPQHSEPLTFERQKGMMPQAHESMRPQHSEPLTFERQKGMMPQAHESVTPKNSEALTFARYKGMMSEEDESVRPKHSEPLMFARHKDMMLEEDESVTPKHSEPLMFARQKDMMPEEDESVTPMHSEAMMFTRQKEMMPEDEETPTPDVEDPASLDDYTLMKNARELMNLGYDGFASAEEMVTPEYEELGLFDVV